MYAERSALADLEIRHGDIEMAGHVVRFVGVSGEQCGQVSRWEKGSLQSAGAIRQADGHGTRHR